MRILDVNLITTFSYIPSHTDLAQVQRYPCAAALALKYLARLLRLGEASQETIGRTDQRAIIVHGEDGLIPLANQCHGLSALGVGARSADGAGGDEGFASGLKFDRDYSPVSCVGVAFHFGAASSQKDHENQ